MDNFSTKVNILKIRFLCFKTNLIFLPSNLSKKGEQEKTNLITCLRQAGLIKNENYAAIYNFNDGPINQFIKFSFLFFRH